MGLRLASSLVISLLVALAAVLIDRTALRGLGLDGSAVVVLERPAPSEVAPPPVLPVPAVESVAARPSTTYPVTAAEAAAQSCDGCSDDEGEEDDMAALFGEAVERLRERDAERGCAKLEQVALRAPTGSIWRDKAQNLRSRRCDPTP